MARASRSASPLRTTATPIVRTPARKYGTGLAKPCSASRMLAAAPVRASSVTLSSAVTPGSRLSVVHRTMVMSVTTSARCPAADRSGLSGGNHSVTPSAPSTSDRTTVLPGAFQTAAASIRLMGGAILARPGAARRATPSSWTPWSRSARRRQDRPPRPHRSSLDIAPQPPQPEQDDHEDGVGDPEPRPVLEAPAQPAPDHRVGNDLVDEIEEQRRLPEDDEPAQLPAPTLPPPVRGREHQQDHAQYPQQRRPPRGPVTVQDEIAPHAEPHRHGAPP